MGTTAGTFTKSVKDLGITTGGTPITVSATVTNGEGTTTKSATLTTADIPTVPDTFTWDNALIYFVIQDRFYDGDSSNNNSYGRMSKDDLGSSIGTFHGGDIKGLTEKLDYINDLGVNAIWITAPYEQAHGWCGGGCPWDCRCHATTPSADHICRCGKALSCLSPAATPDGRCCLRPIRVRR